MDDPLTKADTPQGADQRCRGFPWLTLAVVFAIYVLSTGPVMKLSTTRPVSINYLGYAYAPLIMISKACPPVDRCFKWYIYTVWKVPRP